MRWVLLALALGAVVTVTTPAQAQIRVGNHQAGVCRSTACAAQSTATAVVGEPREIRTGRSGFDNVWFLLLIWAVTSVGAAFA